ncbi:MAG: hypothetical protein PHZ02_01620 [Desulfocapsaceae bacterium]|nr:hypothetical protein [Desulfocapsaceae bacterium]
MVELQAGQTVRVWVAVSDFCGESNQAIYISDVLFDTMPTPLPAGCLDVSGIGVGFRLVTLSDSGKCSMCSPGKVYSTWGSANTDANGLAYIDHILTNEDQAAYQDAILQGDTLKILACITNSKGQQISAHRCSDTLTILPGVAPTHYISLSMGFVPPELVNYFQTYISAISEYLMTYIAPPPAPWQYLYTTYDAVANEFNLWFYTPSQAIMSMSDIKGDRGFMQYAGVRGEKQVRYGFMSIADDVQALHDWITAWIPLIVGVIFILLAVAAAVGGYGIILILMLLFSGLAILSWKVIDATNKQLLAETKATNLDMQLQANNKEDQARNTIEGVWSNSLKTQTDCTTRLQNHRDAHLAKLNGYLDQYAKYSGLVTELTKELNTFTTNANGIINEFKTVPYLSSDTCDTYFVRMNSEIGTSNVAVNDSLSRYIKPDETYSIACKGWTNQAACEKGGCYWYNASCNQYEQCWISDPLGGCILSAKTGKAVVGATVAIILSAFAYWLFTRKSKEVKSIYIGAKEATTSEVAKAKGAYKTIFPPTAVTKPLPVQYPANSSSTTIRPYKGVPPIT